VVPAEEEETVKLLCPARLSGQSSYLSFCSTSRCHRLPSLCHCQSLSLRRHVLSTAAAQSEVAVASSIRGAQDFDLGSAIWFLTNPDLAFLKIHGVTSFTILPR
jgi:hypothetical protein